MGASESLHVVSQERFIYENQECLKTFSSDLHTDVLRLYKILPSHLTFTGCSSETKSDPTPLFVIVLINPHKRNQCFSLYNSNEEEDGEKKFQYVFFILL